MSTSPVTNIIRQSAKLTTTATVERSLIQKFSGEFVNIKDFGVLGDNTTDDRAAFQAALDTGKTVYIPPGTYRIHGRLNMTTVGQRLIGNGRETTILRQSAGNTATLQVSANFTSLTDFSLYGMNTGASTIEGSVGLVIGTGPPSSNKVVLRDVTIWWFTKVGLVLNGIQNAEISNVQVAYCGRSCWLITGASRTNCLRGCNASDWDVFVTSAPAFVSATTTSMVVASVATVAVGAWVFLTGGNQVGQYRQITSISVGTNTVSWAGPISPAPDGTTTVRFDALPSWYPADLWFPYYGLARGMYVGLPNWSWDPNELTMITPTSPLDTTSCPSNFDNDFGIIERFGRHAATTEISEFVGRCGFYKTEFTRSAPGGALILINPSNATRSDNANIQQVVFDRCNLNQLGSVPGTNTYYDLIVNNSNHTVEATDRETFLAIKGPKAYTNLATRTNILRAIPTFETTINNWTAQNTNCEVALANGRLRGTFRTNTTSIQCLAVNNITQRLNVRSDVASIAGETIRLSIVPKIIAAQVNSAGNAFRAKLQLSLTPFETTWFDFGPGQLNQMLAAQEVFTEPMSGAIRFSALIAPTSGTAQGGGLGPNVTLQSSQSYDPTGYMVRMTSGATGVIGVGGIILSYDPATKIAITDANFTAAITSSDGYIIESVLELSIVRLELVQDGGEQKTPVTAWNGVVADLPAFSNWRLGTTLPRNIAGTVQADYVSTAGTAGTLSSVTGSIPALSRTLTLVGANAGTLRQDNYITIAGVSGIKRITKLAGNNLTATIDVPADALVSGAVIALSPPIFTVLTDSGGPTLGVRAMAASGPITNADFNKTVTLSGTGQTATVSSTSTVAGDVGKSIRLVNIGTASWTISDGGADGFNRTALHVFTLAADQVATLTFNGTTAPKWVVGFSDQLILGANQFASVNSANTAFEARTDKRPLAPGSMSVTADGTYDVGIWGDVPVALRGTGGVRMRTWAGACNIQWKVNGANMNGFSSAVGLTVTQADTDSTQVLVENDYLQFVVTGSTGLTGIAWAFKDQRTGN